MSRVGKVPVPLPKGVEVKVNGKMVIVKGPKGQLEQAVSDDINVEVAENVVRLTPAAEEKNTKANWGLYRVLVANMIEGVTKGYSKDLEIVGVGYRAEMKGKSLTLYVGLSHSVTIDPLGGVTFAVPAPNKISITGIDKQAVGQAAANIRRIRPPEPYKGKGVRYAVEAVRRKAGKTGAK